MDAHGTWRHGRLDDSRRRASRPPRAMFNVPPLFCARWTPRGASRPLDWGLTHPNAEIDSPMAMLLEGQKHENLDSLALRGKT